MARNKELGVPEEKYAFARVASFLFQGDTAGAAAVLPRWDGPAGIDPWYQMMAGATLERAGDAHARDRYATAAKLDPELRHRAGRAGARHRHRRRRAGSDAAREGAPQVDARSRRAGRARGARLGARSQPRVRARSAGGRRGRASAPTSCPPGSSSCRRRSRRCARSTRRTPRRRRAGIIAVSPWPSRPAPRCGSGPSPFPWATRRWRARARSPPLQLSAVYEPARALAARVALLGGRLDEALKATEDLDASSPDVAVVRAAAAYERVDADGVMRALEALPPDARKLPFLAALVHGARGAERQAAARRDEARDAGGGRRSVERSRSPWTSRSTRAISRRPTSWRRRGARARSRIRYARCASRASPATRASSTRRTHCR